MVWTHFRDEELKARHQHDCLLCGEKIEKDEKYIKRTGADEGIITMHMHPECKKESDKWDQSDWETFTAYEMPRPKPDDNTDN